MFIILLIPWSINPWNTGIIKPFSLQNDGLAAPVFNKHFQQMRFFEITENAEICLLYTVHGRFLSAHIGGKDDSGCALCNLYRCVS